MSLHALGGPSKHNAMEEFWRERLAKEARAQEEAAARVQKAAEDAKKAVEEKEKTAREEIKKRETALLEAQRSDAASKEPEDIQLDQEASIPPPSH